MFVERINYDSMKMGLNITKKPVGKLLQNIMIDILGFFKDIKFRINSENLYYF